MMPNIPEELVEEILCRVPATSLKRLRSTCKQWDCLFKDRRFSRKHFDKAAKQYPVVVMTQERTLCSLSVNLHDGIPSAEVTDELSLSQFSIYDVFHCDGLLLCTVGLAIIDEISRIVVWNPYTGQTKWIQTIEIPRPRQIPQRFVFGSYQDNKSCNKSYKILSYYTVLNHDYNLLKVFDIYDINSNSWRKLDVTTPIPNYMCRDSRVSLKGKTYWFVRSSDFFNFPEGLICFDYTTERFERLRLPDHCDIAGNYSLSVVGEEKLSVLLQHTNSSRSEVWITNKIDDETKEMSWSKLLEMEVGTGRSVRHGKRFLVDEKKKIVVFCMYDDNESEQVITVSTAWVWSNATRRLLPVTTTLSSLFLMDYVPSLVQIQ